MEAGVSTLAGRSWVILPESGLGPSPSLCRLSFLSLDLCDMFSSYFSSEIPSGAGGSVNPDIISSSSCLDFRCLDLLFRVLGSSKSPTDASTDLSFDRAGSGESSADLLKMLKNPPFFSFDGALGSPLFVEIVDDDTTETLSAKPELFLFDFLRDFLLSSKSFDTDVGAALEVASTGESYKSLSSGDRLVLDFLLFE